MAVAKNDRTILLGEDDLEVRSYLETALKCQGYSVEVAQDGEEVLAFFHSNATRFSALVLDMFMPRKDGVTAMKEIRRFSPDLPIIMISGAASPLSVAQAMKNGASDFIPKPIRPDDLRKALTVAFEIKAPLPPKAAEQTGAANKKHVFFGTSPYMRELQNLVGQIGWSEAPVLIQGETGVGKEVLARELHSQSPRAKKPILKLNCAALPSELVESELFGYERGAFTGAFQKKPGMFELADGGTILLDEIGDMDIKLQAKLLQVLQDQEFQRLGGKDTIRVDVRVIAATHRDLEKAIAENSFREDLYYRLNVINVRVPPLRERKEDILPMAEFLIRKRGAPGTASVQIPASLKEVFLDYHWPGNIRELENTVRRFLVLRDANLIVQELRAKIERRASNTTARGIEPPIIVPVSEVPATPTPVSVAAPPVSVATPAAGANTPVLEQLANAKREAERTAIIEVLKSTNWNRWQAAILLQIDYKALLYKMKKLSIKKDKDASVPPGSEVGGLSVAKQSVA
jgi:two-component system response regulator AtoC